MHVMMQTESFSQLPGATSVYEYVLYLAVQERLCLPLAVGTFSEPNTRFRVAGVPACIRCLPLLLTRRCDCELSVEDAIPRLEF